MPVRVFLLSGDPGGAGHTCRGGCCGSGAGSTRLSLQNELLHYFIFILLETCHLLQTLELIPWILQNPLGMLWAQLPWLDVLMDKSTEYTNKKCSATEPLLIPGALAVHSKWLPTQSCSNAAAEEFRWDPQQMHLQPWYSPMPAPGPWLAVTKALSRHSPGKQILLSGTCMRVVLTSASPTKCYNNIFQKTVIVCKHLLMCLWVCS